MTDIGIREYLAALGREQTAAWQDQLTQVLAGLRLHLDVRLDENETFCKALTVGQGELGQKLAKLEVLINRTKEELQDTRVELKANIRRLEARLDRLEGRIDRVEVRMDRLEVSQEELKNGLGRFAAGHESRITALELERSV